VHHGDHHRCAGESGVALVVQVGCRRAGFYSNDLLDNLGQPSAREIVPELQDLNVGQWVPMSPTPSDSTAFSIDSFEVNRWLLWRKPDSTWAWTLTELDDSRTRLVTRVRACYDWGNPRLPFWQSCSWSSATSP
jgi:hypothetical protein